MTDLGLKAKDFKTDQEVRWCPGCGDYAILAAVQGFMPELGVPRENIEIVCSHCGMGVNPLVLLAVADRLAEDETNWMPFDPLSYGFGPVKYASRWFYPSRLTPRVA